MLDVLESKNIYRKTFCQFLGGDTKCDVQDGSYDAVTVCGAFTKGHLPVDSLREIARILKKGNCQSSQL